MQTYTDNKMEGTLCILNQIKIDEAVFADKFKQVFILL